MREAEIAALSRDYETQQLSYRGLLQKKDESQMAANLDKRQIGDSQDSRSGAHAGTAASPDRPRLY